MSHNLMSADWHEVWQGEYSQPQRFETEREVARHVVSQWREAGCTALDVPEQEGTYASSATLSSRKHAARVHSQQLP